MNKRKFLHSAALTLALCVTATAWSQEDIVSAPKILKSLSKDIVLDSGAGTGNQGSGGAAIDLQVQFAFNSAELQPSGKRQLDELALALNNKALSTWGFELTGHTDRVGSAEYNMKLSLERAVAVKNYLVVQHGIQPARLIPIGLGYTKPADPADPGAAINRRVEVRKVAIHMGGSNVSSQSQAVPLGQPERIVPQSGGRLIQTP